MKQVNLRIDEARLKKVDDEAKKNFRSRNNQIINIIDYYFKDK